jgi:hypothetical protein
MSESVLVVDVVEDCEETKGEEEEEDGGTGGIDATVPQPPDDMWIMLLPQC